MSGQNDTLYISLRLPLTRAEAEAFNKLLINKGAKKGPYIRQLIKREIELNASSSSAISLNKPNDVEGGAFISGGQHEV